MYYILARNYYLSGKSSTYELLPINLFSGVDFVDREEIDRIIEDGLRAAEREYGDDYVEYDEFETTRQNDISKELDLMLLEMDDDSESESPFGEEAEPEGDLDEDEFFDEESGEKDEHEFGDVDPEIFRDPTLLVKWLNKADKK